MILLGSAAASRRSFALVVASRALPGIFPPVYADGDLLVDGGALDNLPVEVMRDRVGSGCVVAVDLSPEVDPLAAAPFEPGLSGWSVLRNRLNPFTTPRPLPNVADILSRSTGLSQVRQGRAALASEGINLLLHPPSLLLAHWTSRAGRRSLRLANGTPLTPWPILRWLTVSSPEHCTACCQRRIGQAGLLYHVNLVRYARGEHPANVEKQNGGRLGM